MPLETPLTLMHVSLGAKMVPFAGYTMPISYPPGIIAEHHHTRAQAGLFDVSHMGQVTVSGQDVAEQLERLMPADFLGLSPGCSTYALLTNEDGGVRDDLIVTHLGGDRFFMVINAGNKHADVAYFKASLPSLTFELHEERALMALQGPSARRVMQRLSDVSSTLTFMTGAADRIVGIEAWVTCSGYTGEDGFEISVAAADAVVLMTALLAEPEVEAVGLGARDSLRLEAGLCLHGHELSPTITPIEAGLRWAVSPVRRVGGVRAGGYPGSDVIDRQLAEGVTQQRVGLKVEGRRPVRAEESLLDSEGRCIGRTCSDAFGATAGGPLAMGYVEPEYANVGTTLHVEVRGKRLDLAVVSLPMVPQRYFRG